MRSGGSLLLRHLLLLLFWGDFVRCIPDLILADSYDGNCFQFHENLKQCDEPVDRVFYNVINQRCEIFVDYGCPAILNRYNSMEQCLEYCAPKNVCHLPPIQGVCNYNRQRWYFDPKTKSCKTFTFRGCGGHNVNNNFERKSVCEQTCVKRRSS